MCSKEGQWTIMVYMAGDNNLDEAGLLDLEEMKKVGSSDQVEIVVQFDCRGKDSTTSRYHIRNDTDLDDDLIQELGQTNTGDPEVLEEFIRWGVETYPSSHYMLVLWNHGNGWDDDVVFRSQKISSEEPVYRSIVSKVGETPISKVEGLSISKVKEAPSLFGKMDLDIRRDLIKSRFHRSLFITTVDQAVKTRAILIDDNAKDFLDNIEMKNVLESACARIGKKIDILGMDACLMSMVEVGYQLKDSVSLTVGSQEVEPGAGWPYQQILQRLSDNPSMTPEELSSTIVTEYITSFENTKKDVTQSVFDLSKSDDLISALDRFVAAVNDHVKDPATAKDTKSAIVNGRARAQSYARSDYIDLFNFCELVGKNIDSDEMKEACQSVMDDH